MKRILLGNALIWAGVMLLCAYLLRGTDSMDQIEMVLLGGAAAAFLLVETERRRQIRCCKPGDQRPED